MKIKYFSQLCEQPHVNQFSHQLKFQRKVNRFFRLAYKMTIFKDFQQLVRCDYWENDIFEQNH